MRTRVARDDMNLVSKRDAVKHFHDKTRQEFPGGRRRWTKVLTTFAREGKNGGM